MRKIIFIILGLFIFSWGMLYSSPKIKPIWITHKLKPDKKMVKAWLLLHRKEVKNFEQISNDTDLLYLKESAKNDTEFRQAKVKVKEAELEGWIDYQNYLIQEPYLNFVKSLEKYKLNLPEIKLAKLSIRKIQFIPLTYSGLEISKLSLENLNILVMSVKGLSLEALKIRVLETPILQIKMISLMGYEKFKKWMGYFFKQSQYKQLLLAGKYQEVTKDVPELAKLTSFKPQKIELKGFHVWRFDIDALRITTMGANWEEKLKPMPVVIVDYDFSSSEYVSLGQFLQRYQDQIQVIVLGWGKLNNIDQKPRDFDYVEIGKTLKVQFQIIKTFASNIPVFVTVCVTGDKSDIKWLNSLKFRPDGLWIWNLPFYKANFKLPLIRYKKYSTQFVAGGEFETKPILRDKIINKVRKLGYRGVLWMR